MSTLILAKAEPQRFPIPILILKFCAVFGILRSGFKLYVQILCNFLYLGFNIVTLRIPNYV